MNCTRREFLITSGMAVGAAVLNAPAFASAGLDKIGLQLYTLRDACERDFAGTLRAVRQIGYQEVEFAGFFGLKPAEVRKLLSDIGLSGPSAHFVFKGDDDWARNVDASREIGVKYVVCPVLPTNAAATAIEPGSELSRATADDFKRGAETLNRMAARAQQAGLAFAYHNHNYEFRKLGETTGFDLLLGKTDPKLVKLELDVFWLAEAGLDPAQTIRKHADRAALLHLKDRKRGAQVSYVMDKSTASQTTEVGSGTLGWPSILAAAKEVGVAHCFVEQDISANPMESVKRSYEFLAKMKAGQQHTS